MVRIQSTSPVTIFIVNTFIDAIYDRRLLTHDVAVVQAERDFLCVEL